MITIATDGSVTTNPGPGGWAALFRTTSDCKVIFGCEPHSTNIRMEMTAVIKALNYLKRPCEIELYTDSEYVTKGITIWIKKWKKNGFMTAPFKNRPSKEVSNKDLWLQLDEAVVRHQIKWEWVRGHNNHADNEKVDEVAGTAAFTQTEGELILVPDSIAG